MDKDRTRLPEISEEQQGIFLLYRQFAETLQAVTSLSKSLEEVHADMRTFAENMTEFRARIIANEEKLALLIRIVQGDGTGTSLYKDAILHGERIKSLEDWKENIREKTKENKTNFLTKVTIITSIVIGIVTAVFGAVGPAIVSWFKGTPSP